MGGDPVTGDPAADLPALPGHAEDSGARDADVAAALLRLLPRTAALVGAALPHVPRHRLRFRLRHQPDLRGPRRPQGHPRQRPEPADPHHPGRRQPARHQVLRLVKGPLHYLRGRS